MAPPDPDRWGQPPTESQWKAFAKVVIVVIVAVLAIVAIVGRHKGSSGSTDPTQTRQPHIITCFDSAGGMHPSFDGMDC